MIKQGLLCLFVETKLLRNRCELDIALLSSEITGKNLLFFSGESLEITPAITYRKMFYLRISEHFKWFYVKRISVYFKWFYVKRISEHFKWFYVKRNIYQIIKHSGGVYRILSVLFKHTFYLSPSIHAFLAYTLNPKKFRPGLNY